MISLKPIKLDRSAFDVAAHKRAIKAGLDDAAKQVKADFEKTTATFQHKPTFSIEAPSDHERVIGTDDQVYEYLDEGTRPHVIVAHGKALAFPSGHQAKTRPRVIGSGGGGSSGATIVRPRVQHPGTDAREFSTVIAEQAEQTLADAMQRAIDGVA